MERKPLFILALLAILVLAFGGGNAIRKAMDPSIADAPNPLFAGIGQMIRGAVTARLGYSTADAQNPKQVMRGAQMYVKYCAQCHGKNLEGETANWRQRKEDGTLPAPPHDRTGHTWHHSDDQLFRYTKLGGERLIGGDFKSGMPGFDGILSDSDIWSILAYIKSTWPGAIQERQNKISGG